jgi:hypothetical protein
VQQNTRLDSRVFLFAVLQKQFFRSCFQTLVRQFFEGEFGNDVLLNT